MTPTRRPGLDLFLVSGLILFAELALIRWLPAHVLYLSFFTNTVLLASFVGMSVGLLAAHKPGRELARTPFWLAATLAAGLLVLVFRKAVERHTAVGDQERAEVVFFGTEVSQLVSVDFTVPVELFTGAFFALTAAVFVGPGQELGRGFARIPSRTRAYSLDLLGSLAGIGLFAAGSAVAAPPPVWFAAAAAVLAYLLARPDPAAPPARWPTFAALAAAVALTVPTAGWVPWADRQTAWSPYYRIDYTPADRTLVTNLLAHQHIVPRDSGKEVGYHLPYLFLQGTGRPAPKRVLIIGAGSGNDLARACYWCPPDARIDAVEIDPVIQRLGVEKNPDRPYADPRVTRHLNDGRNFLRTAPAGEYDLVVFALIDSLVLHSGYSSLRLESYLFTREAFADVARVLKPDGLTAVYNYFRQPWIVARIRDAAAAALGADPVVLCTPPPPGGRLVTAESGLMADGGYAAVFAGREAAVGPLRAAFADGRAYWTPGNATPTRDAPGGFGAAPPTAAPGWVPLRPTAVDPSPPDLAPATDDWPFLYVRSPGLPALTLRGAALTLALAVGVWWWFRGRPGEKPEPPRSTTDTMTWGDGGLLARAFLLGAGFMLIETRAVVQMALLFGSTWTVNTVVFAAVLVMALAGNLFAGWVKPRRLEPYYVGLFAALAVGLAVPAETFLGLDPVPQIVGSCAVAFAPVLFAGVVFPVSFARTPYPDRFFGANVAGSLVGGLAENLSLLLGFRYLLAVAVGLYALSALFGGRSVPTPKADAGV